MMSFFHLFGERYVDLHHSPHIRNPIIVGKVASIKGTICVVHTQISTSHPPRIAGILHMQSSYAMNVSLHKLLVDLSGLRTHFVKSSWCVICLLSATLQIYFEKSPRSLRMGRFEPNLSWGKEVCCCLSYAQDVLIENHPYDWFRLVHVHVSDYRNYEYFICSLIRYTI